MNSSDASLVVLNGAEWLVSSGGVIRTVDKVSVFTTTRNGRTFTKMNACKGRVLRHSISNSGYMQVSQSLNGKRFHAYIHRLVGVAFVDGFSDGLVINHKNGNRLDNRPENLEWVTQGDNLRHAYKTGLSEPRSIAGDRHHASKVDRSIAASILSMLRSGESQTKVAKIFGISQSTVSQISTGKHWTSGDL